jgi:methionyl-tRNA synthetase
MTPAAPAPAATAPAATEAVVDERVDIDYFMKVKLRVARIEAAEPVPKSNKLLKLQLDLGPLGKRQILAGIAKFYTPESLVGRRIVVVANLQPAKLMGLESQGMLLAASSDDGSKLLLVDPGQDMPEGSTVR